LPNIAGTALHPGGARVLAAAIFVHARWNAIGTHGASIGRKASLICQ